VEAFDRLVEQHSAGLYRLSAAIVGVDDAADATQDTFLQAWLALPGLRQPDRFEPWLRRILVNRCRNVLRSRRRSVRTISVDHELGTEPLGDLRSIDFRDGIHSRAALDAAFERLDVDHRSVLALHYVADLTLTDVATTLEIPVGTAKSRLNAGLRALRAVVSDEPR
jgi:RNA polymerase sigma-70 factor (ECF subfamily)